MSDSMKYFKKYEDKSKLNEKLDRDSDINILGIFSSLFSSIGRANSKRRLKSIGKAYDNYLMITYKLYISNSKLNIEKEKVDTFNFADLNQTINVEPIEKDSDELDIDVDEEKMADLVDDGQIENRGLIELDLKRADDIDVDVEVEDEDDVNVDVEDIESGIEDIDFEEIPSDKQKQLHDTNNQNKGDSNKDNSTPINSASIDDDESDDGLYVDDMSKDDRRLYYHKILTARSNAMSQIKYLKNKQSIYDKIINKYVAGKKKNDAIAKNQPIGNRIKKMEELISNTAWEINQIEKKYPYLRIVRESREWTTPSTTWSDSDSKTLTSMINPYKITEFSLQANLLIENSNEKNTKSLTSYWNILKNEIHKRWYFTYDIKSLESGIKQATVEQSKKSPEEKEIVENAMSINMVLKETYKKDIVNFTSPYYTGLKNVIKHYFVLNVDSRLFLLNRVKLDNDVFIFKIIGNLKVNNDKSFDVDKLLNDSSVNMKIDVMGKSYELYKEKDDFPVLVIKGSKIYSLPVFGRNDNAYVDMLKISIGALNHKSARDILIDIQPKDLNHNDLTDEQIETIKKIDI